MCQSHISTHPILAHTTPPDMPAHPLLELKHSARPMPGPACRFPRPPGPGPPWGYAVPARAAAPSGSRSASFGAFRPGVGVLRVRSRSPTSPGRPVRPPSFGAAAAQPSGAMARASRSTPKVTSCRRAEVYALLPPAVAAALRSHGVDILDFAEPAQLVGQQAEVAKQMRSDGWLPLLRFGAEALVSADSSPAQHLALWRMERELRSRSASMPVELHSAIGRTPPEGRTAAGPSPRQELLCLEALRLEGITSEALGSIVDNIAMNRARAAVGPGSGTTYASHQRMIEWACGLFGMPPVPASPQLVRRVAALVNAPATLRGWLAAWRDLHIQRNLPWAGDADPLLRRIRASVQKAAPPPPPKKRLQIKLLRKVVRAAARRGEFRLGGAILFAYLFGLRVPSELLAQIVWSKFHVQARQITIAGLKRKGKRYPSDLTRLCVCQADQMLCWHLWYQALREADPAAQGGHKVFPLSVQQYTDGLRRLLAESGIPGAELRSWSSHCARRGSGADVLAGEGPLPVALGGERGRYSRGACGLSGMLAHGEWASKHTAMHYASLDEMDRHAIATAIVLASDSD